MLVLLALELAQARPDEGAGMWTYDESDTVTFVDGPGGRVRVWFSTSGTNAVLPDDADGNGAPDFAEDVASTAEAVLENFETLGVEGPLPDHGKGGDDRLDAYLVDFGGNADGNWATEGCDGDACYGYFQMENDFAGYGYPSLHDAVAVLTSHELFHGVQAAYGSTDAVWFSEGTATWAEDFFQPGVEDFVDLCGAYLIDSGRSLSEPPSGPVPAFAYGTALWWWFLTDRYGPGVIPALLTVMGTSTNDDELLAGMAEVITDNGGDLREDFVTFGRWNLATAARAGTVENYPFAADLRSVVAEAKGESVVDDNRFYPLSTTYYELQDTSGREFSVATSTAAEDLTLTLALVDTSGNLGATFTDIPADGAPHSLGTLDAESAWIIVSNPTLAANSTKLTLCAGSPTDLKSCAPADTAAPPDSGETGTTDTSDTAAAPSDAGCGCETAASPSGLLALAVAGIVAHRRRFALNFPGA